MRKNSFMEGAMIATVAIIVTKIIGLLYVIPFYSIIGVQGSILYGYAYSIYAIFLSLSSSGIPIAISKIISEYNALGYYNTKERAFKIGASIIVVIGIISFILLFIFSNSIATLILGELKGGNTIEDVSFVIKIVSFALLVVPILSVTKGYLQGHKFIEPTSISNILEQITRVTFILLGSFIIVKKLNLPIKNAVAVAVFGATAGALTAYIYLVLKINKNKNSLNKSHVITRNDAKISNKEITKKIILYALPFILIDLLKSAYAMIDTFTVVNTLVKVGYSDVAELTIGVINNFGAKINMIIVSVSLGITVSLIPNIASSYIKKNFEDISDKINKTLETILFIGLPMTMGLLFLVKPVWIIFYSLDEVSIAIFKVFVFQAIIVSIYSILVNIFQTMNNVKVALGTLIISFIAKLILNVPSMLLFAKLKIPPYYGPVLVTIIIQFISIVIMILILEKKYNYNYKKSIPKYIKIILSTAIMYMSLKIVSIFFPLTALTKMGALFEVGIYGIIGVIIYGIVVFRSGLIYEILGKNMITKLLNRMKKPKKL